MIDYQAVKRYRSEEMKELRRRVGDRGGIKFFGRPWRPGDDGICNCITLVLKDFYVIEIYD